MPSIALPVSLRGQLLSGSRFSPLSLFATSEPGVWYDPSDVANLAWRRNLLTFTEQFDNAAWNKEVATVTTNVAVAPDGTTTADKAVITSRIFWFDNTGITGSKVQSLYVKADGSTTFTIIAVGGQGVPGGNTVTVNLTTGAVTSGQTTGVNVVSAGNSWWRVSITSIVSTASGNSTYWQILANTGVLLWGAQLELGSVATDYQRISDVNTEVVERFPTATMFQDTAGTTPVTTPGQTVARINDKSGRGNNATQATTASRPTYGIVPLGGRRNLLVYSEDFAAGDWLLFGGASKTGTNIGVAPDGTTTADGVRVTTAGTGSNIYQQPPSSTIAAVPYTFSCYVKRNAASNQTFQLFNNLLGAQSASGNLIATDTWQRFSHTSTATAGTGQLLAGIIGNTSGAQADLLVWGAQLELGSTATAYQRVGTAFDVTEAGVRSLSYLSFDGVDDFLVTPTITPGIDEVQVFAGVRKLSDAAAGVLLESSTSSSVNAGTFGVLAPSSPTSLRYDFRTQGTVFATASTSNSAFAAPITNVLTGLGDISGDVARLRINGVQTAETLTDQGTGNYLAYPIYIGRRGGTSLPFNGQIYSLIVRFGANLDAGAIYSTETFVNEKTGAY
jgi:hypothetical protein